MQKILRELLKSVYACEAISAQEQQSIIKNIQYQLKNPDYVAATILAKKIQARVGVTITVQDKDVEYPGKIFFSDLMKTGKLCEVTNSAKASSVYLYFDRDFVANFYNLNPQSQQKFQRLVQYGDIRNAAAQNDQGIKYLGDGANLPKCKLNLAGTEYQTHISHELKICDAADRIGVVSVKPLNDGPELLIATHTFDDGLHSKKHNGKKIATKPLVFAKIEENDRPNKFGKMGFFTTAKSTRTEGDAAARQVNVEKQSRRW